MGNDIDVWVSYGKINDFRPFDDAYAYPLGPCVFFLCPLPITKGQINELLSFHIIPIRRENQFRWYALHEKGMPNITIVQTLC